MTDSKNDIWVLLEVTENGKVSMSGLELFSPGRKLADDCGGKLTAVIIGEKTESAVRQAGLLGAERVLVVQGRKFRTYSTDAFVFAFYQLLCRYSPFAVLISATPEGRDLAPRLAARAGTGLTADCTDAVYDPLGKTIIWTRPAYGGKLMAEIVCPEKRPQMGTIRPGVFSIPCERTVEPEICYFDFSPGKNEERIKIIDVIKEVRETVSFDGADVIISGGRGLGGRKGFELLSELASLTGGVIGASRAAVDAGWIPRAYQIGQTGKTVSPRVYFACGISGAVQHLAGMNRSQCIIAINNDPEADIFNIADYGVIGDLHQIIPAIIDELESEP